MSLPTFGEPLSARAAKPNFFAQEILIIRVTNRFSGSINEQDNRKDLDHVEYSTYFEQGPLKEFIPYISRTKFSIAHERSPKPKVRIKLFRLEPDIEEKTTVSLRKRSNGYELPQADPSMPEDSGFSRVWSERRPTVEYGGREVI
jgi:hypothetical protein